MSKTGRETSTTGAQRRERVGDSHDELTVVVEAWVKKPVVVRRAILGAVGMFELARFGIMRSHVRFPPCLLRLRRHAAHRGDLMCRLPCNIRAPSSVASRTSSLSGEAVRDDPARRARVVRFSGHPCRGICGSYAHWEGLAGSCAED